MARHSEVKFYASKKAFMTTYKGKRYTLRRCEKDDRPNGANYQAAVQAFAKLIAEDPTHNDLKVSVDTAIQRWLSHVKHHAPASYNGMRSSVDGFSKHCAGMGVGALKPRHVLDWIDSHANWNPCTRKHAATRIKMAIRYNFSLGYIEVNPLAGMKLPKSYHETSRGAEYIIPADLGDLLIQEAHPAFADYLRVLRSTGARPVELSNAEHWHYNPDRRMIVFSGNATKGYRWKNAGRGSKGNNDRIIYLNDEADAIIRRNAKKRGWLLPNKDGEQFERPKATRALTYLKKTATVARWFKEHDHSPTRAVLYSFRHTWITRALERGTLINDVAALCGTSAKMIENHYGHSAANTDRMRDVFNAAQ